MRVFNRTTICLVLLSFFWVPAASTVDFSAEYRQGRWVIDNQSCASPDSEYIEFYKNGTILGTRTGRAEFVGFWGLKEGILDFHMVTSPAYFDDLHEDLAEFAGIYSYFPVRMVIFNTKEKSFEAFGVIGDEIRRASAVRCK